MKTTYRTAVIVSMVTLVAGACAANTNLQGKAPTGHVSPWQRSIAVTVANNNFADMKVYAVFDNGVPRRIGTVTGHSSATLIVRSSTLTMGTLRLVASPIGGRGAAHSGPLMISSGQSVRFMIQPTLSTSYGTVR